MNQGPNTLFFSTNRNRLESYKTLLRQNGFGVQAAGTDTELATCLYHAEALDLAIVDLTHQIGVALETIERISLRIFGGPVLAIAAYGDLSTIVQALQRGAYDFVLEPVHTSEIINEARRTAQSDFRTQLKRARQHLWSRETEIAGVFGNSKKIRMSLQKLGLLSRTDLSILLTGKNGTGKKHLAHTAHFLSKRRFQPFITIDCTTTDKSHLAALLFGEPTRAKATHLAKFSGAIGNAKGGTLLLDEVTELPKTIQKKLLRILRHKTSDSKNIPNGADIRVMSTSRQNQDKILASGKLDPNFYRLVCGSSVEVPSLAERPNDIDELSNFFLEHFARKGRKKARSLSAEALRLLKNYSWPENVRELRNLLERVVVLKNESIIESEEFSNLKETAAKKRGSVELIVKSREINSAEEALIFKVLTETNGNVSKSAAVLGISRGTLYSKMRKYGLINLTRQNVRQPQATQHDG